MIYQSNKASQILATILYGFLLVRTFVRIRLRLIEIEEHIQALLTIINGKPRRLLYECSYTSRFCTKNKSNFNTPLVYPPSPFNPPFLVHSAGLYCSSSTPRSVQGSLLLVLIYFAWCPLL